MAVVIFEESQGVFLGSMWGLGFWSKLETGGQTHAVTFDDAIEAEAHMATWNGGAPVGVRIVEVEVDSEDGYASSAACMRAGLPGWLAADTPVANVYPV